MDPYEATRVVFSRIQNLDPENASKIMGLLLIQDHGEKEMIRLAFGPETLVHSVVLKARKELGLPSNSPTTPSTPSSPSPFLARQNSSPSASRLSNGGINIPPPSLTIPNTTSSTTSWAALCEGQNQDELVSPHGSLAVGASPSSMNSSALPFYGSSSAGTSDVMDDFQLHDQLSFLNDNSPSSLGYKNQDVFYPQGDLASSPSAADHMLLPSYGGWGGSVHRRSCSVNDVCLGSDDQTGGFGWKPCMYFARGYCKNGTSCKFLHGGLGESTAAVVGADGGALVGSPNKLELMDKCHELLRSKAAQQQRLAAASQLMASSSFPYSPKSMNLFLQQQNDAQRAAAALMMNEDMHKFGRSRLERNEIVNPASRQIYLTFPADSTFREEDVSSYFSIYGPVEDVRIPYQQKRMFGFVTFVYPETVKIILAKGNPHFVCDSRVLVKPYKEKGKASDKKQQQQQVERGEFSPCGTPTGMESRDPFDLQIGPRMFNAQDILWRRKLEEQADFQQALELQSRRLMNLQLLDVRKQHHLRAFSTGSPIASPTQSPNLPNQNIVLPPIHGSQNVWEDKRAGQKLGISVSNAADQMMQQTTNATGNEEWAEKCDNGKGKESSPAKDIDLPENLEHNLPDNPFAYPSKTSSDATPTATSNMDKEGVTTTASSSTSMVNGNVGNSTMPLTSSSMEMSSFKSFNCQMPRLSSGHGAIGMPAGSGGPTCPVGI